MQKNPKRLKHANAIAQDLIPYFSLAPTMHLKSVDVYVIIIEINIWLKRINWQGIYHKIMHIQENE